MKPINIIIFGRQGSGKGTQSLLITKEFGPVHISTGDMLRAAVEKGTETAPNKAVLMNVFPNKETAMKARAVVADRKKQVKELIKIETTEGEVVFNQNSLTQE